MTDQELLQAMGQMMEAQKLELSSLMDEKLAAQRRELMHDVAVLMDAEFKPKFDLLAEELKGIREQLEPTMEKIERMEETLEMHHTLLKLHSRQLRELKEAK